VGVLSLPIVMLVQLFIGVILALNMAPTLDSYGQIERVADIVVIAVFRELGPLITAILLSGFAGASIAAELGAMVEGEEIKALRAHALDPIRFLVVPRVLATAVMMVGLTVVADVVGVVGGLITAVGVLGVSPGVYLDGTRAAVDSGDYLTGLVKAGVFGVIIAALACYEGLNVRGGAVGVGRATTMTVVKSIVALIAADTIFATVFYTLGW
jgi:phospholipid/cholesterol/gamma-HCH transport system permease protein